MFSFKKKEKIVSFKRVTKPGDYILKINSFTWLSKLLQQSQPHGGGEGFESSAFKTGRHTWKLSVYPNGNTKNGGDNRHLSLYLVSADDGVATDQINASFKLFIMDQIRGDYLTVQDGQVRMFHGMKKEWGFTKMIPLKTFKDPKNGYLVDDCCVFGVEVSVIPSRAKSDCLSLMIPPSGTFTWEVDNFLSLNDSEHSSDSFIVGAYHWNLSIWPNGDSRYKDEYCFSEKVNCIGVSHFLKLTDLEDKSMGFLVKDKVVFEVSFNGISKISDA